VGEWRFVRPGPWWPWSDWPMTLLVAVGVGFPVQEGF
jgi:hypothetical protein